MTEVSAYASAVNKCCTNKNAKELASLVSLPFKAGELSITADLRKLISSAQNMRSGLNNACVKSISDDNIGSVASARLSVLIALSAADWAAAFESALLCYNGILEFFKEENVNWIIPVLVKVSNDFKTLAIAADEQLPGREFLRNALENLTKGFSVVAKDRSSLTSPGCKRLAIFAVTNVLFKIYFKVNTLQLCGKLINIVESPNGPMANLQLFAVSDVAMYFYYLGRLKMFEDRYEEARDHLRFSLRYTPADKLRNRQRILSSLVPVEMCLGIFPTEKLETVYGLSELYRLGIAVRQGDLCSYEQIMQANQHSFIKIGVYLSLEQAKMLCYRCLFKRLALSSSTPTRLNLVHVESAVKLLGESLDLDEIECIIGTLIYQGKVKGYISHQKRMLVLAKTGSFPTNSIIKPYTFKPLVVTGGISSNNSVFGRLG